MKKIIDWINSNKFITFILLIIGIFLLGSLFTVFSFFGTARRVAESSLMGDVSYSPSLHGVNLESRSPVERQPGIPPFDGVTPQPEVGDRMTARKATQSLLVRDVKESTDAIERYVVSEGGYVVHKRVNQPEGSSSGYISVRVPTEKLESTLEFFADEAVRVVQETVSGEDITDRYEDTQAQLEVLERTKAIFEGLLEQATEFDEILRAQQEILKVQRQIDDVKGRIEYMEGIAKTALIEVNLSTDELELGYAPEGAWRPTVVFRRAVRSLVGTGRKIGGLVIWAGVYSVIWVPVVAGAIILRKRKKKHQE